MSSRDVRCFLNCLVPRRCTSEGFLARGSMSGGSEHGSRFMVLLSANGISDVILLNGIKTIPFGVDPIFGPIYVTTVPGNSWYVIDAVLYTYI